MTRTTYGYNPFGDLVSTDYSDTTPDVSVVYDRLGRQLSATANHVAQSVFTYRADTLQPETETIRQDLDGDGDFDFERTFTRTQDDLLRSTGFSLAEGAGAADAAVTYGYEPVAGRMASVTLADARVFTYAYDAVRPALMATVTGPAHRVINTWEGDRDVLDIKSNQTLTGAILSQYDYTVNGIGQRTAVEITGSAFDLLGGGGGGGNRGWTWEYDSLGQLSAATHAANPDLNRGYIYDTIGNRWQAVEGTVTAGYLANLLNQYREIGRPGPQSWYPQYDDDGNQLSGALGQAEGKTFEWDGENRLIAVKDSGGAVLVSYTYDHGSRRVRRTVGDGSTTLFVFDRWNLAAEYSVGAGGVTLSQIRTWGLDLSGTLQGAGGVGGLLVSETPSGGVTYPAYDANGNVTVVVESTGTVSGVYEYDPYGGVLASAGAWSSANAFRFSTKPEDSETGWSYYGFRYYDPTQGRWTSRDPIEERGGLNLCGFVSNDGVNRWDDLGNNPMELVDPYFGTGLKKTQPENPYGLGLDDGPEAPGPECQNIEGFWRHCMKTCYAKKATLGLWTNWLSDLRTQDLGKTDVNSCSDRTAAKAGNDAGKDYSQRCADSCMPAWQKQRAALCCATDPRRNKDDPSCSNRK